MKYFRKKFEVALKHGVITTVDRVSDAKKVVTSGTIYKDYSQGREDEGLGSV